MPKKLYNLDQEGKHILEITWKGNYKNMELKINNKHVGKIENKEKLIEGSVFEIGYNKSLSVKLVKEMLMLVQLQLLLNGRPLAGSMTHPLSRLKDVFWFIVFIASVNLILGIFGALTGAAFFTQLGVGFWNIIYAGIIFLLGIMVREKQSMIALVTVIVLLFLDIISFIAYAFEYPELVNPAGPVIAKVLMMIFLFRGINAVKEFNKMEFEDEILRKEDEERKKQTPLSEKVTEDHNRFIPKDHSGYMPG